MDKNWENPEKSPNLAKFTTHSNQVSEFVDLVIFFLLISRNR